MSDPDAGWVPTGRPQSTLARNFSAALDHLFKLDSLSQSVEEKKQSVTTQNQELETLEAQLRETEQRLKRLSGVPDAFFAAPVNRSSQRRSPATDAFGHEHHDAPSSPTAQPLAQDTPVSPPASPSRKKTPDVEQAAVPGALPDTPQSHAGSEYVAVDKTGSRDSGVEPQQTPGAN